MEETRYFIFNSARTFKDCRFYNVRLHEGRAVLDEAARGLFITPVLDSLKHGNVWRRVLAQIDLPEGTRVAWRIFSTDLDHEARGIGDLQHGELSAELLKRLKRFESFRLENTADFLLPGVCGRYIVLAAELFRPEDSPPVILHSLRLYSAWESFLQYLPEYFREEDSFLDRYLRLFSAPYLDLEQSIDALSGTFDPCVASPDTLRWLAGVIGIPYIGLWETERLRKLLISGTYRHKGRLSALPELIEHFTGFSPYVIENFRMLTGEYENDRLYQGCDLNIYLPPEASGANLNLNALCLILDSFLPGGVTYRLLILDMYPVVPDHAYLGINLRLGRYPGAELGVNSRLNFVILGGAPHGE